MIKANKILFSGLMIVALFTLFASNLYAIDMYANDNRERVQVKENVIEEILNKYWDICVNAVKEDKTGLYDEKSITNMKELLEYSIEEIANKYINVCKEKLESTKQNTKDSFDISKKIKITNVFYVRDNNYFNSYYNVTYNYFIDNLTVALVFSKDSEGEIHWLLDGE